ncbi:MAG: adenosylcobalamin-dependent ribonucleoside-diphosphate reductase [Candidatus Aminicenantes bacterium]|nr:adenosylcobalamin-dependent ribonucleoside-diphosphate reductase [Candidatus Aminicenantes bacterium]
MENFSENALKILKVRYFKKDEKGKLLESKPSELFGRVARFVAKAEKNETDKKFWQEEFFQAMMRKDFMPNSPTLTGADRQMCLSACFVLPIEDSLDGIFETVKNAALVHKEGGGTGFDFSRIRPAGSFVRKTQGIASGPVSFLRVIDAGTEAVKQGGTRRGANMGVLRIDHPDIRHFITMKRDGVTAQNFNISVAVTDAFIQALEKQASYDLVNPMDGSVAGRASSREVFDLIVDSAWTNGDPGLIFIDKVNRLNPTAAQGPIRATNPCGEQPLHDYEACNLGSINLLNLFDAKAPDGVDWPRFRQIIQLGIRFLDDVIDVNLYPLEKIDRMAKANRRIGLGVMGFADLLIRRGIAYNTEEARALGAKIVSFLKEEALTASRQLAEARGSFPNIDQSIYKGQKMRNAAVLTIAPTGTISRIAGCSSSIEPIFAFQVISKILDSEIVDIHPLYREWQEKHPGEKPPAHFITAQEIPPLDHLKMQAVFQEHVDSAVSKTINFPNAATREDIASAYMQAFGMNIKGITVYRDGCRAVQVLNKAGAEKPKPMGRPDAIPSTTHKISTGLGNLYITVSYFNDKPFEVFASIGKSGYSTMADAEAIGRLISLALRSGISTEEVVNQLKGIGGAEPIFSHGQLIQSIPDAIAKVLETHIGPVHSRHQDIHALHCPVCGSSVSDEKCPTCANCGWSKCNGV